MTALDSIGRAWALVTGAEALRLALGFIVSFVLARALGPATYGTYAVLAAMVSIVGVLAEFGLSEAAVLRLSNSDGEARAFFWLRIALASVVIAVLCLLAAPLAKMLGIPDDGTLTRWALLGIVATACSGAVSVLLQANGAFGRMSTLTLFNTGLTAVLAVLLALTGQLTITSALVVLGIGTSLATFALGLRLLRQNLSAPPLATLRHETRQLLKTGRWLWLAALLAMLAVNLDVLIVSRFLALEAVGAYALAANLASKASIVNHSLYTVLLPGVAGLGDQRAIRAYLKQSLKRSAVVALGLAVAIPLAQPFVLLVYGEQFALAVPLLQLLLGVVIFDVLAMPMLLLPLAYGRARLMAGADGARAATLLAAGTALVPLYGPVGAVIARFASRLAGAVLLLAMLQVQHKEPTSVAQSG
ncbi:MAG TPA: oligosaccharide flippase family protein [Chloroflexota bacterium]|nr:oligosaccharide flippase family protein [Chloroflexota bacterium]